MEYHRTGPHQGFWRLKTNHEMIPDAKMFELLTPEHVVLSESMQVGQRHLLDSGYGKAAAEMDEAGDDSKLDLEQQLAPWITTKNFMHAMQNKAMIRLHGPGDHTGRGEGFSAIRVSMKEVFVRSGEDQEEAQGKLLRHSGMVASMAWLLTAIFLPAYSRGGPPEDRAQVQRSATTSCISF